VGMGINLAQRFEDKTSDLLKAKRKSKKFTNDDWDWDGVNAIIVTTLTDPTIVDYNANGGANRYGNPTEVEDTQQTWTLTRDRAWTKTMDKKNQQDAMMIRKPGKYLAQVTKNKMVPEIDSYIFQVIATAGALAGTTTGGVVGDRDDIVSDAATSAANAYTNFLLITANIRDLEAPEDGLVAAMTASYYNFLKQGGYIVASEKAQTKLETGDLGEVDGVGLVSVPSTRMPSTSGPIDLLISHPSATVAPEKLVDYTLHKNPPGISGDLLEYRHRYDGFVDANKLQCIGMHAAS
jgi:hypothetical protein